MIYITGDCHGDYTRFNTKNFPEQKQMTKDDFVIVCGDFGFWTPSKEQEHQLEWLSQKPFTTLFVDGNHECFDELYNLPIEEFCGGKVHFVKDSIIHLMRGQVFNLDVLISIIFLPSLELATDISSSSFSRLGSLASSSLNLWILAFCFVVRALAPCFIQASSFLYRDFLFCSDTNSISSLSTFFSRK